MQHFQSRVRRFALVAGSLSVFLTGCGFGDADRSGNSQTPIAFSGHVLGGRAPVSNSQVSLYAIATSGYGANSSSLLGGSGYVTTDSNGVFSFTLSSCPTGGYVYALAKGGNPGLTPSSINNAELAEMAMVGSCSSITASTQIQISEATTMATAYALAQFATSETAIGTSSTNVQGMANAFLTYNNMIDTTTGYARATTPSGNGYASNTTLNALANALASCTNSDGTGSPCASLMTAANVTTAPIDTAQAAINIAKNQGTNVSAIWNLVTSNGFFQPTITSVPNDWSYQLYFTTPFTLLQAMAIDFTGDVWVADYGTNAIGELSPAGVVLNGNGYTSTNLYHPTTIAVDSFSNVWASSRYPTSTYGSLQEFNANGTVMSGASGAVRYPGPIAFDTGNNVWSVGTNSSGITALGEWNFLGVQQSPTAGYTGGGLQSTPNRIAIDTSNNVWVASTVYTCSNSNCDDEIATSTLSKFSAGVAQSPAAGYTGGGLAGARGIAIDGSNTPWIANAGSSQNNPTLSLSHFSATGTPISGGSGYAYTPTWLSGAGGYGNDLMIDGNGNFWPAGGSLFEFNSSGTIISPANAYEETNVSACGAIDATGNIWLAGYGAVVEVVGIAAPVIVPTVSAVKAKRIGVRP